MVYVKRYARESRVGFAELVVALRVGIVGLPNSGKTTLFNALTHAGAQVTAYADVTQKPNLGMAVIADDRLDRLAEVIGSRKVTPAAIRVVDVPGRARFPASYARRMRSSPCSTGSRRGPIQRPTWRPSASSSSSPTATTSSAGSSECGRRRSPATGRSARRLS